MKIPRDTLLTCPLNEAANQLYELGKALRGNNLKHSSWPMIANGLRDNRGSHHFCIAQLALPIFNVMQSL